MGLERHKPLLILDLRTGALRDTKHDALARTVDVRVENPHLGAFTGQGQCQVGCGGGFPHAALAGRDGHHVFNVRQARNLRLSLVCGDHTGDVHASGRYAVEPLDGHLQHLRPATLEQTGGITQFELNANAVALNIDIAHAPGADRVLVQVRVGVLAKDGFHRCAIDGAHGQLRKQDWKR
ncbi:hypothetical protein D3C84_893080 [compost metagenome]